MPGQSKNQWNKTLRFSWGHIIMALALIFISYVVFMGCVYLNKGNFVWAGIIALINFGVLFSIFIGVQRCKAAEGHFARNIIWERILLCLCVLVFFISFFFGPYNHFFGIFRQHKVIEKEFSQAIVESEQLFTEYEEYANERISRYETSLSGLDGATGEAYLKTLKLQLLSENESELKTKAVSWIDNNKNARIWNIYLMGNVDKITRCITEWYDTLVKWSEPVLTYETDADSFASKADYVEGINVKLNNVAGKCVVRQKLQFNTIWTSLILFFMLFLPYLIQNRNTKAQGYYILFPKGLFRRKGGDSGKQDEGGDDTPYPDNDLYIGTF